MNILHLRRTLLGIALIAGMMAMILSCGGSLESPAPQQLPAPASAPAAAVGSAAAQPAVPTAVPSAAALAQPTPAPATESLRSAQAQQGGRQLIVEAWMTLEVADVDPVARQVEAVAAQRGGWVESSEIFGEGGYRSASISIRVPADNFDTAMASLRSLGRVTDEGVGSTDVTARLIDNEARLVSWRSQEERLIHLLDKAETLEHVIDLEKRLSEVRTDIELVAATQRNLENRVAASLIKVNVHLPQRFAADPPNGTLTLAVVDPPAAADAVVARVETLNGYIGRKREFQQDRGQVVEMTAFVPSVDLAGLMDYAATLGEISDRRLDSVGPAPVSEIPDARLSLVIRSNVANAASTATLSLSASAPLDAAGQIRDRAESLGGYVESWRETRQNEADIINLELAVKPKDLRDIMDYGASLGKTENWEFSSVGQGTGEDAPNARLSVSVFTGEAYAVPWTAIEWALGVIAVVGAVVIVAVILLRRRGRDGGDDPGADVSQRQPLVADDDAGAGD